MKRVSAPMLRNAAIALGGLALLAGSVMAPAQVQPVDPDKAIDGDLLHHPTAPAATTSASAPALAPAPGPQPALPGSATTAPAGTSSGPPASAPTPAGTATTPPGQPGSATYHEDDLIGAADGVFGKGAKGIADVIRDLLKKQGEPNGYIVGREGGGAFVVGLRYGSGTLYHKIEGQRPVYWTGPSVGFDAGANAGNCFVLVYNLYNTDDLFHRYAAGEGQAYLVGGFNMSYLRRKDVVLIPIRVGAGLRLGVNAGYMKFSTKQKWMPF